MAAITVLCASIGRSTLAYTVRSFLHQAGSGDQMVILGDGWDGYRAEDGRVSFRPCPKAPKGQYGHPHIEHALTAITTEYVTLIDDDDVWLPKVFATARQSMHRAVPIWFGLVTPSGDQAIRPKRAFLPNKPPFTSYGPLFTDDRVFWDGELARHPVHVTIGAGQLLRVHETPASLWGELGLHLLGPAPTPTKSENLSYDARAEVYRLPSYLSPQGRLAWIKRNLQRK